MTNRHDLVDLALFVHADTALAWHVSDTGQEKDAVWLPKSQVEVEFDKAPKAGPRSAIVSVPAWLAAERELV